VLVVPTIGTTFTVAEVLADPVDTNTALGHYTHFGNLLDLVAVAVPVGTTSDGRPASVLLLGAAQTDDVVLELAARLLDEPRDRPVLPDPYRGAPVSTTIEVTAEPSPFRVVEGRTALVIIDMQRDFLLPGGFGETLGNDVSQLQKVVPPLTELLAAARAAGMLVIHTREGHLPDLSDCPPAKLHRGAPSKRIGDPGAFGRILIQGEYGHDIVDELAPIAGEVVIDKPGKGAFYATDLQQILTDAGITQLLVTGVTTEVCVHTTTREANDRGYECLVVSDCVGSYFPEFQRVGLEMVKAQGGIFGWVSDSRAVIGALSALTSTPLSGPVSSPA
jgi:nicotinamidase-related amidase